MKITNIQKYLASDFLIQFGSGMSLTVASWFILEKTGMNQYVSTFFMVNIVCGILISILGGLILDRFDKKKLVIYINTFRLLTTLLSLLLLYFLPFNIFYVYILAIGNGIGWNLYLPASKTLLQQITEKENLLKNNSFAETAMQVGMFSAGALGGILYKYVGFLEILAFNLLFFLLANLFLRSIKTNSIFVKPERNTNYLRGVLNDYKEILTYAKQNALLFLKGFVLYIPFIAALSINVSLPGYVGTILKGDSVIFGIVDMFYSIGACLTGIITLFFTKKLFLKEKTTINLYFMFAMIAALALVASSNVFIACLGMMAFGIFGPGIRIILYTEIMEEMEEKYFGRSLAFLNLIGLLVQAAFLQVIGIAMDNVGVQYGFLFYSLIMFIGFSAFVFSVSRKVVMNRNEA